MEPSSDAGTTTPCSKSAPAPPSLCSTQAEAASLLAHLGTGLDSYGPSQLHAIAQKCQTCRSDYVQQHFSQHRPIRLLVICEAPPWRPSSVPLERGNLDIYQPNDQEYNGNLLGAVLKGVAAARYETPPIYSKGHAASKAAALAYLGRQGVMLVDVLPLALPYSGKGTSVHGPLRDRPGYALLAGLGFQDQLRQLAHLLHPQVMVAFSLRKLLRALLGGAREGTLKVGDIGLPVSEEESCFANDAGQPDARKLCTLLKSEPTTPLRIRHRAEHKRKRG